jgi:hypothetical protein
MHEDSQALRITLLSFKTYHVLAAPPGRTLRAERSKSNTRVGRFFLRPARCIDVYNNFSITLFSISERLDHSIIYSNNGAEEN